MAATFTHLGSYSSIPADASTGLLYLKNMLPALDSLDPSPNAIMQHLSPDARFIVNGGSPVSAKEILGMLRGTSRKVKRILSRRQGRLGCGEGWWEEDRHVRVCQCDCF
jgi:hypothetical protein